MLIGDWKGRKNKTLLYDIPEIAPENYMVFVKSHFLLLAPSFISLLLNGAYYIPTNVYEDKSFFALVSKSINGQSSHNWLPYFSQEQIYTKKSNYPREKA